jgi:hypothetical protein
MLSTGSTDGRGIVGKVGDFGLSLKMDVHETHISQVFQGTLSHMAPGELGLNAVGCSYDAVCPPCKHFPKLQGCRVLWVLRGY